MTATAPSRGHLNRALRAAQYVRMSTDHQQYSPIVQREVIATYAAAHGISIVRTYEDAGISGLTLRYRPALIRLLLDVENPKRDFSTVLVYDVSRWGRFQDVDESGYHEYLCRRAGVRVVYCAESFENDGSPASSIFKAVKRAMAGEFSRELSTKVFLAQCLGAGRGYHEGGRPGYGLRRKLVDGERQFKCLLERHEYKAIQTDRCIMTPGPAHEVALVRQMYRWFAKDRLSGEDIARRLNSFGLYNDHDRPWQAQNILRMLRSERYIGTNVYNRTSSKLELGWTRVPESQWVRAPGAFEPVVDRTTFRAVQTRMEARRHQPTKDEIAQGLKTLLAKTGRLTSKVIRKHARAPSVESVTKHFGGLLPAYTAIGYLPAFSLEHFESKRVARMLELKCVDAVLQQLREMGHQALYEPHTSTMCVDDEFRVQIVARAARFTRNHRPYWTVRWPDCFPVDLLVFGRTERMSTGFLDFHVLPHGSLKAGEFVTLYKDGTSRFDVFRHPDLRVLLDLVARTPVEVINESATHRQRPAGPGQNPESPHPGETPASGDR